jgi:hypothetical protein
MLEHGTAAGRRFVPPGQDVVWSLISARQSVDEMRSEAAATVAAALRSFILAAGVGSRRPDGTQ